MKKEDVLQWKFSWFKHPAAPRAALVGSASTPLAEVKMKTVKITMPSEVIDKSAVSLQLSTPRDHTFRAARDIFFLPSFHINHGILYTVISTSQHLVLESYQLAYRTSFAWTVCPSPSKPLRSLDDPSLMH